MPFFRRRYDLKQGTSHFNSIPSRYDRLMNDLSFFVNTRDLQEPGVQGACRAGEARGRAAQGVERDEEEARRRGPGLISLPWIGREDHHRPDIRGGPLVRLIPNVGGARIAWAHERASRDTTFPQILSRPAVQRLYEAVYIYIGQAIFLCQRREVFRGTRRIFEHAQRRKDQQR